jgi:HlyD family secretion protein
MSSLDNASEFNGSPIGSAGGRLHGDLRRGVIFGGVIVSLFAIVILTLSFIAPFDAAVSASGQISVLGSKQAVQHRDGGIVSALLVREGDHVKAGQVLMQVNADEVRASRDSAVAQIIHLRALKARLEAELEGRNALAYPEEFKSMGAADQAVAADAMKLQEAEFRLRRQAIATTSSVLAQKSRESEEVISGMQKQVAANQQQQALLQQEMSSLKGLLDRGLVPATRMRSLQRNAAELSGNEGQYLADVAKTNAEIGENRIRATDLIRERAADDSKELQETDVQLAELEPKAAALNTQLERADVRAPATGRVIGLSAFTVGGVVAPGQLLMSIVPDGPPLVIDVKLKPADVSSLHVGQSAEIRISALHDLGLPVMHGVVDNISADSFVDEKTGAAYFRAEVSAPPSMARVVNRPNLLYPGLPVEVVIPLRSRTAWAYFTEPLTRRLWTSFRQQ